MIVFLGDEVTAAGMRLAGVETPPVSLDAAGAALADARTHAEVVILAAEYARSMPAEELEAAIVARRPLVVVLPELPSLPAGRRGSQERGRDYGSPSAFATSLRATLGIGS